METENKFLQVYSEQMSDSVCVPRIPPDGQESAALLRNAELNGFSNVNGSGSVLMVGTIDRNNLMLHSFLKMLTCSRSMLRNDHQSTGSKGQELLKPFKSSGQIMLKGKQQAVVK